MSVKTTVSGLFWNGTQNFALQALHLLVSMVLARLLMPADFGLIALIAVFISVSDTISAGGFQSTIIMRPNLKEIDYSTAFVYNLTVAMFFYLLMFFFAPVIAKFYDEPRVVPIIRVQGLVNILHAGYFVQNALLQRNLKFKFLAQRNILATVISGAVAIAFAYFGFGVWALVAQAIARAIVVNVYLWIKSVWKLSLRFSWKSFRKNFAFGSRLMLSTLSGVLFNNLNNLIIGKYYSKADLGYYYQAKRLESVPIQSATAILTRTSNPMIAKYQHNMPELHKVYLRLLKMASMALIPLTILLFVVGPDLILALFSAKWQKSISIFRIIIVAGLFQPFISINGVSPAIMGDSKFYLRIDLIYKAIILVVSLISLRFGLMYFIASQTVMAGLQMLVNTFIAKKYYKVGLGRQYGVMLPYFLYSLVSGLLAYLAGYFSGLIPILRLSLETLTFMAILFLLIYLFEPMTLGEIWFLIQSIIEKFKGRKEARNAAVNIKEDDINV